MEPFCLNEEIASLISNICCHPNAEGKNVLPQGAPTSPTISNFICERLDQKLDKLATSYNLKYTRYADDITFSGMKNVFAADGQFCSSLKTIIECEEKFTINTDKTRLLLRNNRQEVTGLTINEKPNVPRKYIKQLRCMIHNWETKGYYEAQQIFLKNYNNKKNHNFKGIHHIENIIAGKLDYLKMVKGEKDSTYISLKQRFEKLQINFTDDFYNIEIIDILNGLDKLATDIHDADAENPRKLSDAEKSNLITLVANRLNVNVNEISLLFTHIDIERVIELSGRYIFEVVDSVIKIMSVKDNVVNSFNKYSDILNNLLNVLHEKENKRDDENDDRTTIFNNINNIFTGIIIDTIKKCIPRKGKGFIKEIEYYFFKSNLSNKDFVVDINENIGSNFFINNAFYRPQYYTEGRHSIYFSAIHGLSLNDNSKYDYGKIKTSYRTYTAVELLGLNLRIIGEGVSVKDKDYIITNVARNGLLGMIYNNLSREEQKEVTGTKDGSYNEFKEMYVNHQEEFKKRLNELKSLVFVIPTDSDNEGNFLFFNSSGQIVSDRIDGEIGKYAQIDDTKSDTEYVSNNKNKINPNYKREFENEDGVVATRYKEENKTFSYDSENLSSDKIGIVAIPFHKIAQDRREAVKKNAEILKHADEFDNIITATYNRTGDNHIQVNINFTSSGLYLTKDSSVYKFTKDELKYLGNIDTSSGNIMIKDYNGELVPANGLIPYYEINYGSAVISDSKLKLTEKEIEVIRNNVKQFNEVNSIKKVKDIRAFLNNKITDKAIKSELQERIITNIANLYANSFSVKYIQKLDLGKSLTIFNNTIVTRFRKKDLERIKKFLSNAYSVIQEVYYVPSECLHTFANFDVTGCYEKGKTANQIFLTRRERIFMTVDMNYIDSVSSTTETQEEQKPMSPNDVSEEESEIEDFLADATGINLY